MRAGEDATLPQTDSVAQGTEPEPERELSPGEMVGRFQVRRLAGRGGMGQVYLARDLTLGRSVALKLLRAADPTIVEEARVTARLNHPNIVQLFDVGQHGDKPYLALEYLDGESLADRMAREQASIDEGLRTLRAIAAALAHAHERGVTHCDLKPRNVMLARDGRVRVVDFGLATAGGGGARGGTADWMAPEQWDGAPSPASDVWALAVVAWQVLTGEHPFGPVPDGNLRRLRVLDETVSPAPLGRPGIPDAVASVMVRSLARAPAARPPMREWLEVLDGVLAGGMPGPAGEGPFRGIAAFEERHTSFFFGRDDEIDAFLERLREHTTLPIVGPSAVGKSSFLFAGILPRLRLQGRWTVLTLRPGSDPLTALAFRLLGGDDTASSAAVDALAEELRAHPPLLAARLATMAAAQETRLVLAIDQLEEVFTQEVAARDREAFLAMIAAAADDPGDAVRIVYTLRDDFLGRVPTVREVFVLGRLDGARLRRVVLGPLERLGYAFDDPGVVDAMLVEVKDSRAALPLLQAACRALWDARDATRKLLLADAYRAQGGVVGALAGQADALLSAMRDDEQQMTRQMLTRLVVGKDTRRIVAQRELLADLPPSASAVLDRLLAARLVVVRRAPGREATVEIAHEALVVAWGTLARWLEESGEERRLLAELDEAASFWERRGRRAEETWAPEELAAARARVKTLGIRLPARVDEFLRAGEARATAARRRGRARRAVLFTVAAGVTIASVLVANALRQQRDDAERQAAALRLAGGNLGRATLDLRPFDWVDGEAREVPLATVPDLRVTLYAVADGDPHLPGERLSNVRVDGATVEAPGGPLWIRFDGRGRLGDRCAASWIRVQSFPGYAERATPPTLSILVPTCQASLAQTILVPAGEFIYGGPGTPPTRFEGYVQEQKRFRLDGFRIDETEGSNAQFASFARHAALTGYPVPMYPDALPGADAPERPVTAIDAYAAEAFCRYLGKRLPTDLEWTKAARGGLVVNGQPNPLPMRLYPWGDAMRRECVNIDGEGDPHEHVTDARSYLCGASPYGVLNLAGNVFEWIARTDQQSVGPPLRVVRGGAWHSPPDLEHATTIFRNTREARYFEFATGVRCVADEDPAKGSEWQRH